MKHVNNKSHNIAKGGILTALSILFIYLSTVLPINKLFLMGLSSCLIPLSIILTNIKNSFVVYFAVSILSLFLVPSKGIVMTYILIFGLYGFIKYYIEKLRKAPIEIILKLLFLNISVFILYFLYTSLFTGVLKINIPIYGIIAIMQLIFILYDYSLTVFISYINTNFINRIK